MQEQIRKRTDSLINTSLQRSGHGHDLIPTTALAVSREARLARIFHGSRRRCTVSLKGGLKAFLLSGSLLGLAACHTPRPLTTASGRPEVVIQGKSGAQILKTASDFFLHR